VTDNETFIHDHIDTLLARDLDRLMHHYAVDAVLRAGGHEYRGRDAVRAHLETALASSPAESRFEYRLETPTADRVVMIWALFTEASADPVLRGSDAYVLRSGRIAEQTVVIG